MMQGLQKQGLYVIHGASGKFFALFRTAFRYRPIYLHLDWLHQYYLRRTHWMTWLQFPFFVLEVLLVRYLLSVKLVWTLHNIYPHDKPYYGPYKWARLFFAKNCSWVRVFHEGTKDRASAAFGIDSAKFRIIAEGSYVGYYPNNISPKKARQHFGIPEQHRVLLYLGLIKPYKGILELVQIFKAINPSNTTLLIAGKALNIEYLQQIEREQVENIMIEEGFVSDQDLQLFYNASDLVVLPFKAIENSGSAILAMGFKKAIIAPRKGVIPERLKQQEHLLYEDSQLEKMLIKGLRTARVDLSSIGHKNSNSLKNYQWEDFASCFR